VVIGGSVCVGYGNRCSVEQWDRLFKLFGCCLAIRQLTGMCVGVFVQQWYELELQKWP
jgi:hypothetical protein